MFMLGVKSAAAILDQFPKDLFSLCCFCSSSIFFYNCVAATAQMSQFNSALGCIIGSLNLSQQKNAYWYFGNSVHWSSKLPVGSGGCLSLQSCCCECWPLGLSVIVICAVLEKCLQCLHQRCHPHLCVQICCCSYYFPKLLIVNLSFSMITPTELQCAINYLLIKMGSFAKCCRKQPGRNLYLADKKCQSQIFIC